MSAQTSADNQPLSVAYILLMLIVIVTSMIAYLVLPWLIAIVVIWPGNWGDLFQMQAPLIEKSVLWNGKLCVPHMEINFAKMGMPTSSLVAIDPESKKTEAFRIPVPFMQVKLVADDPTLWCVANAVVIRIQDGNIIQTAAGRTLKSTESAFRYRGRLAVIENSRLVHHAGGTSSVFELFVWSGTTWQSEGELLLPRPVDDPSSVLDAATSEMPPAGDSSVAAAKNELVTPPNWGGVTQVAAIEVQGTTHWFCTDGSTVLHSTGDAVIHAETASALAPENAGLAQKGWDPVGTESYSGFGLGSDSQGVMFLEGNDRRLRNPLMPGDSTLLRFNDGRWFAQAKQPRGMLGSCLVSDGAKAYIVSQSVANHLVMKGVGAPGSNDVRFAMETGGSWERLAKTVQSTAWWSPYLVVFLFALTASWIMARFRSSRYEFGNRTVELASVNRRTLAKVIDWLIIITPTLILKWVLYGWKDQQEIAEAMMPPEIGIQGIFARLFLIILVWLIYCLICVIGLAVMEGAWGISPGKWLCGIRVIRTTLRRTGFLRAFLREVFVIAECIPIVGWFASTCCVAFTDNRQRLGDLVADTIVVRRPVG
jgi:uncharacterized RDD family membrane protein YckC